MVVEFDPAKDAANLAKHGVSLVRAVDLEIVARVSDDRYSEPRFRAYGYIEGEAYCLAYAVRGDAVRVISLRRARNKEMRRYEPQR